MAISRVIPLAAGLIWLVQSTTTLADGLDITVVNVENVGVVSEIVAMKGNDEKGGAIVGTTLPSGKLPANNYKCDSDHNLIARPLDSNYFHSFPAPCSSPHTFLVMSRVTTTGDLAFYNFGEIFVFANGTKGQFSLKPTINVNLRAILTENKDTHAPIEGCAVNYNVKAERQLFQFTQNEWNNVEKTNLTLNDFVDTSSIGKANPDAKPVKDSSHPLEFILPDACNKSASQIVRLTNAMQDQVKDAVYANKEAAHGLWFVPN